MVDTTADSVRVIQGPDHPVDFPPIKAISLIVCQLTNKEPTVADYVTTVLQDGYNGAVRPLQQFRSSGLSQTCLQRVIWRKEERYQTEDVILILTKYYHADSSKVLESSLWRRLGSLHHAIISNTLLEASLLQLPQITAVFTTHTSSPLE
ncbi:hypothetical protein INR49_028008 [Caranx melampygus]|nr:hypothetical protein INR49_028008 [Caranx melampygus]